MFGRTVKASGHERRDDVIGVCRLREIIKGADLDRHHGGGDRAVAGEDDAARVGAPRFEGPHDVEPATVAQFEVDDRERRRRRLDSGERFADAHRGSRGEAPSGHRPGQSVAKHLIVIDDQQRFVERLPATLAPVRRLVRCVFTHCRQFSLKPVQSMEIRAQRPQDREGLREAIGRASAARRGQPFD